MNDMHAALPLQNWLTPAAIARATGLAVNRVRRWVAAGRIRAWRAPSGHYLIDPCAVAVLIGEAAAARTAPGNRQDQDEGFEPSAASEPLSAATSIN